MHHPTDRIAHTTAFVTPVVEHWLEREMGPPHEGSIHRTTSERSYHGATSRSLVSVAISRSSQCSTTGVTGSGMCYPVCGMVHIKDPLPLIGKSSLCGGSGFPFSLSEWSLTICLTPYNRK